MAYQIVYNGKTYNKGFTNQQFSVINNGGYTVVPTIDLSPYLLINNVKAGNNISIGYSATGVTINSIGTITGATNLGGVGLYNSTSNKNLQFKGLKAGNGITLIPSSTGVTINSSVAGNFVSASTFNQYTGTTAPITYALKSNFNTYTGTTAPTTFVSKTSFNSFTGSTINTANNGLTKSGTNVRLGGALTGTTSLVGTTANTITLKFDNLKSTQTNGAGLWLTNTTTATSSVVQNSPSIVLEGQGFKNNPTTASQSVKFSQYVATNSTIGSASGNWGLYSSINGGAFSNVFSVSNGGLVTLKGNLNLLQGGGQQITFPNMTIQDQTITFPSMSITDQNITTTAGVALNITSNGDGTFGNGGINLSTGNASLGINLITDGSSPITLTDNLNSQQVTFGNGQGLQYATDISSTYVDRTLVDQGFVHSYVPTYVLGAKTYTNTQTFTSPIPIVSASLGTITAGRIEYNGAFYGTNSAPNRYANGGVIADFYSSVGNSGSTETDLYSYLTKINTLNNNGEKLKAQFSGTIVGSGTASRAIKVYFAGIVIYSASTTVSSNSTFDCRVSIVRTSSTTARSVVSLVINGVTLNSPIQETDLTPVTFTTSNYLKITGRSSGTGSASNDIVAKLGTIFWWGAANN